MGTDDRDKRRNYHTPVSGVPIRVDPRDELSVPILVDNPTMSRTRSESTPPRMTQQELARDITLRRRQMERDIAAIAASLSSVHENLRVLDNTCTEHRVHLDNLKQALGEFEDVAAFRQDVYQRLADGFGKDGDNGKHGALKKRFDQSEARKFTFIMFALGLLVTAGTVVFWAGSTVTSLRSSVQHLESDVNDLRARRRPASAVPAIPAPEADL